MNQHKSNSTTWALLLIAVAIAGAGISYHFTLESRFASIEAKLDQNAIALQQYQISQETVISSKTETLNTLNKEVDSLQSSLEPLGKATQEQTDSLTKIHQQIVSLEQSQQAQQDAQKKLADYATQLEKVKHDLQAQATQSQAPAAAPLPPSPTPVRAAAPQAYAPGVALPLPPRADSGIDLRPAQTASVAIDDSSVRALPVALPVDLSASEAR